MSTAAWTPAPSVVVNEEDGEFILCLRSVLDGPLGAVLADATAGVADAGGGAVCVDLTAVDKFTDAGVDAIGRCRTIAHERGIELRFRADSPVALHLLLSFWARN